jgi:polysaccharide pyruvyl transferase WcaK-like protein
MKFPRASPPVSHIALLTPYDGGNLGDAAIQEALISNFRRFHSPLQISGITLDPERTAALHSIPCYLLAINSRPHYKVKTRSAVESTDHAKTNLPDGNGSEVNFFSRLRRRARLSAFLKPIRALFRLAKEGRHVLQSYLLLREVDLLVVAGGGQLDEEWGGTWGHPYALMKWSVLARLAGAKTVFLSVGSCRIESRVSRKFVQVALSLALYRSYRDEGSRQIALGISPAADGPVVPDLAFSLPSTHNEPLSEAIRKPLHVGVSPIAFSRPGLWPTERAAAYERYMTELGAFVTWLLSRGASVTLFSSSTPDEQTFKDLRDRVSPHIEKAALARLSSRDVSTVRELVGLLQSMDFVVASRLHGLLLSFLAAKPSLAISYDRKVQKLMEDLDQARYCFDIRSFTCRELLEAFLDLQAKADFIPRTLADIRKRYDMLLENQYRLVAEYLSPGSYGLHPLRSVAASPATARRSDSDVREIR